MNNINNFEEFNAINESKKEFSVSYNKKWDNDGTTYNQTINVTSETFDKLKKEISDEIKKDYPRKKEYVFTSGTEFYLKPLTKEDDKCYLNHTQLRFIGLILDKKFKEKNTCLCIID